MTNERAFEQQGEEQLPTSHRQWQAGEHPEPDISTMVEVYDVMVGVNQRLAGLRARPIKRTLGDIATGIISVPLIVQILSSTNHYSDNPTLYALLLGGVLSYNYNLHRLDRMQAALTLQEYDKRWIGPLFEALAWPNARIRAIVRVKLLNLLPLMAEEDARYLSPKQRSLIYTLLMETKDKTLQLALLKAMPHFGDSGALEIVEKLALARVWTPGAFRVRSEARTCLPLLRERVRKLAERMPEQIAPLSSSAGSTSPANSEDASTVGTTSAETNTALAKLEEERAKVERPAMRMAFLIADWCIIVPFAGYQSVSSFATHQPLVGTFWLGFAAAATQLYRVSLSNKRVAVLRKQARQRDVKAVGIMAEALDWPDQDLRYEAGAALIVLLPQLKANQASLLNATQRQSLHQVLKLQNARTQADLMVAILRAFQQVGDNAAIPYVEQLANARPNSPQEQKVVQEAQECLPYLLLCANNNSASHSLLRASSQADTSVDNLLRPTWENPETRPEQLLRPSDSEIQ